MNLGFFALVASLFAKNNQRLGGGLWGQITSDYKSKEQLKKQGVDIDKSERMQEELRKL